MWGQERGGFFHGTEVNVLPAALSLNISPTMQQPICVSVNHRLLLRTQRPHIQIYIFLNPHWGDEGLEEVP